MPEGASLFAEWCRSTIPGWNSRNGASAAASAAAARRIAATPREKLAEWRNGTESSVAIRTASAVSQPVVPERTGIRCARRTGTSRGAASGAVNSNATSHARSEERPEILLEGEEGGGAHPRGMSLARGGRAFRPITF